MIVSPETTPTQFGWPSKVAEQYVIEKQHNAFKTKKPITRSLLAPHIVLGPTWLGDAIMLHDLGWWWLKYLHFVRLTVSMGYEKLSDYRSDGEVINDVALEALGPVEKRLFEPLAVIGYLRGLSEGISDTERGFAESRPLVQLIQLLEDGLTGPAMADLKAVTAYAEDKISDGTFAGFEEDETVQRLAKSTHKLLGKLQAEKERIEALQEFSDENCSQPTHE